MLSAAARTSCQVPAADAERLVALPYEEFDTAEDQNAWRTLNGRGCVDAAVVLLSKYEQANASRLSREQRGEMAFHRGQALAFADRKDAALPHFEQALLIGGSEEWLTYVGGTIAFLRSDQKKLHQLSDRYSTIAPGSMREKFLRGLEACPSKPYMLAVHCAL